MKIAIILSGQPRQIFKSLENIQENLIKPNNIKHVFAHFWWNPENIGLPWSTAQQGQIGKIGLIEPDCDRLIIDGLNPTKFICEPQKEFPELEALGGPPESKLSQLASNFYSTYRVFQLKQEYEKENNFEFDCVIRARWDLFYFKPIDISKYINEIRDNKLICFGKFQRDQDAKNNENDKPLCDIFSIANSKTMDVFCSLFPELERLNNLVNPPYGENFLGRWTRVENGIQIHHGNFSLDIMHRVLR